jgi:lipopolysaccharide export system permease protein
LIIFRYILKELALSFFAVLIVLLMIIIGGRLIKTLAWAAAGEMSFSMVLLALLYKLPSFLEIIIPMSFFIAILIGYGRLYAENEMTVLTATGFSDSKLLGYVMAVALFLTFAVASFSLWLTPLGGQATEDLYVKAAQQTEFELIVPGRFQSMETGNRVTYTEALSEDKKQMRQVFIADGNSIVVAQSGHQYVSPETGSRFLELEKGKRYDLTPGSAELKVLNFDRYGARLAQESQERAKARKESVPTLEILGSQDPVLAAQVHWRFSLVAFVPIVGLLAFPLSKVQPRQGRFARMFPALVLFIIYAALVAGMVGVIEKGKISPWLGVWAVHGVFLSIALLMMAWPSIERRRYVRRVAV